VGVPAAGRLDPDLGETAQPGEQRSDEVDGLDAVVAHLAVLPEDRPRVHLEGVRTQAIAREPPREQAEEDGAEDGQRDGPELDEGVVPGPAGPIVGDLAEGRGDPVDLLRHEVPEDGEHDDAAPDEGRDRVDPREVGGLGRAHRPARCASPCADNRTRSSSATSTGRPGRSPLLAGEAVLTVMSAMPCRRLYGPEVRSTYWMRP